jgi:hypothetical protein
MYRFGGAGRKKSPSINPYFFCYKCKRSYKRHLHACTDGRGSNQKQFGAIHQHDASLLPKDTSIYSSSALSPILASSENSNIEDLSSITTKSQMVAHSSIQSTISLKLEDLTTEQVYRLFAGSRTLPLELINKHIKGQEIDGLCLNNPDGISCWEDLKEWDLGKAKAVNVYKQIEHWRKIGFNDKEFGAIHQHDASLLPRDPSIYFSSALSPILASSEKSNIEDLSSILNSSFPLNEIVNARKDEGVAAVNSDIYEGIDSRAGSRQSLRTGAGTSRHDGDSDRSCNTTKGSDATFDIQEGVGINNGGNPIEQLMHLFGSQFVDDWMGEFFGFAIFYFSFNVEDFTDLDIPQFLLKRCPDGRTVRQCINAGCGIIGYINNPDDTHFFALKKFGRQYVIKDPYDLQYQVAGSEGFCQIFALMIATDNDHELSLNVNLNNWIGFQFARNIVDTMADKPLIRASMIQFMDPTLDANDFDVFRAMLLNIDCEDVFNRYFN